MGPYLEVDYDDGDNDQMFLQDTIYTPGEV